MEKMTFKKAIEIVERHELAKKNAYAEILDILEIGKAYGFIEGWNAWMEFEAELNGKPSEPYISENGIEGEPK